MSHQDARIIKMAHQEIEDHEYHGYQDYTVHYLLPLPNKVLWSSPTLFCNTVVHPSFN